MGITEARQRAASMDRHHELKARDYESLTVGEREELARLVRTLEWPSMDITVGMVPAEGEDKAQHTPKEGTMKGIEEGSSISIGLQVGQEVTGAAAGWVARATVKERVGDAAPVVIGTFTSEVRITRDAALADARRLAITEIGRNHLGENNEVIKEISSNAALAREMEYEAGALAKAFLSNGVKPSPTPLHQVHNRLASLFLAREVGGKAPDEFDRLLLGYLEAR